MPAVLARSRVDLLLLVVAAAWGSTYLVSKDLVTPDSAFSLLAARMLCAGALMAVVMGVRRRSLTAAEVLAGVPIGLILAVVFGLETFGIARTSPTNAGLIISLTMVFTPLLESAVQRRRLPLRFFGAALLSVAGVILLAGNGSIAAPGAGDLLVLAAAVARSLHVVAMHRITRGQGLDSLNLTTVQLCTCAVSFTVAASFYGVPIPRYLGTLSAQQIVLFIYLVLACTVLAFLVQLWAVRRTSPSRVSLLLGTEPVWAAITGILIAHDNPGTPGYLGIALVLAGTAWGRTMQQRQGRAGVHGERQSGPHENQPLAAAPTVPPIT